MPKFPTPCLILLAAGLALPVAKGDEALKPRTLTVASSSVESPSKLKDGVTHLDPAQYPNKKRMAPTRKSEIDDPIRAVPAPTIARQDRLILKTLSRDELMKLILDGVEEFLLEIEPVWVQVTDETGYWAIPATTRHAQIGWEELPGIISLVGFLALEREQDVYAGRYARSDLLDHVADCIRYIERNDVKTFGSSLTTGVYEYVRASLPKGRPIARYMGKGKSKHLDDAEVQEMIDNVRRAAGNRNSFAMQNSSGARQGILPVYASEIADLSRTEAFVRENIGEQIYWSLPQDRAVRWADFEGRTQAQIRAGLRPTFYPDGTTTEHGHFSFVYINARFFKYRQLFFTAAVAGRRVDELPLCYQGLAYPELAKGMLSYVRTMMRYNVSPDGCVVYPSGVADMHRTFSFALQSAYDATVNENVEAASYLSRQVQHEIWNLKRPFGHLQKLRHRPYIDRRVKLVPIYYMLKNWSYPDELLSWEECHARHGGTSFLKYQDLTYHRNPHKQLQTKTSPGERTHALVCNFCPSPSKQGHGMEFLRQFVYASERDEVENFTDFRKWRITKEGTHSSLWGDYGEGVGEVRYVDLQTRKVDRWDDGFNEILRHSREGVRRALFSLGGRTTVIIEESDRLQGKQLPMRFWVFNQDCMSMRAGHCPPVDWKIHLPGRTVSFADYQYTADGQAAVIAENSRWYNVDERLAVALPNPQPLMLGTMEWRHVRDSLYFGPSKGGAGVVYAGVGVAEMRALSQSVRHMEGLPEGWKGLTAKTPEGYRVYTIAKFQGNAASHSLSMREREGAPVFSLPTTVAADGAARVDLRLPGELDTWSAEPRFFIRSIEGAPVVAQARHHALQLSAPDGKAKVKVAFYCDTRKGALEIAIGQSPQRGVSAEVLRNEGIEVELAQGQQIALRVSGAVDDDRRGPYVEITAPEFYLVRNNGDHRSAEYWHPLPKGDYTFKANAQDRSGVAKVEFYLNNGQLVGTDTEAPFECTHEINDSFCQFVYVVAYDGQGNRRRSFDVPFGDGSIGPRMLPGE